MKNDIRSVAFACTAAAWATMFFTSSASAQFNLLPPQKTFEEEQTQAAAQHDKVVSEFGGAVETPKLTEYINQVGQKVVQHSSMPEEKFVFTILNSPQVNAFTIGGGYVYVTRGMLAVLNSEAELAALLGHEIGHVTGRHTAHRNEKVNWKLGESGLMTMLTGDLNSVGPKILGDVDVMTSYSANQERSADAAGFKMIRDAGYDLDAMTNMLSTLQRYSRQASIIAQSSSQQTSLNWLADHPDTDERIRTAAIKSRVAKVVFPDARPDFRDEYLTAIDGLIYGTDPKTGVVQKGEFIHKGLKFSFTVPDSLQITNTPEAVFGVRDNEIAMMFAGMPWPKDRTLEEYATQVWSSLTQGALGPIDDIRRIEIHGMDAIITKKIISGRDTLDIHTVVYRFSDEIACHMSFVTPRDSTKANADLMKGMAGSLRKISRQKAETLQPKRLKIVSISEENSLASMADHMAFSDYQLGRFKALNGVNSEGGLHQLKRAKVIVDEGRPASMVGSWQLVALGFIEVDSEDPPTLNIGEDGKVNGMAGVNRFNGELAAAGDSLFEPLAVTRKLGNPEAMLLEVAFLGGLNESRSTRLRGRHLLLQDADGVVLLDFVPVEKE